MMISAASEQPPSVILCNNTESEYDEYALQFWIALLACFMYSYITIWKSMPIISIQSGAVSDYIVAPSAICFISFSRQWKTKLANSSNQRWFPDVNHSEM